MESEFRKEGDSAQEVTERTCRARGTCHDGPEWQVIGWVPESTQSSGLCEQIGACCEGHRRAALSAGMGSCGLGRLYPSRLFQKADPHHLPAPVIAC